MMCYEYDYEDSFLDDYYQERRRVKECIEDLVDALYLADPEEELNVEFVEEQVESLAKLLDVNIDRSKNFKLRGL